jgi:hypothetical protein
VPAQRRAAACSRSGRCELRPAEVVSLPADDRPGRRHRRSRNEGARGNVVLEVEISEELFDEYEWVKEGKTYPEALIPAPELNRCLESARALSQDEEDEVTLRRFAG